MLRRAARAHHAGALTTIKGVNKVDVVTLGSTFSTLAALMTATSEQLAACPGIGPTKVKRIHDTFQAPFRRATRQPRITDAVGGGSAAPSPLLPPPPPPPPEPAAEEEEDFGAAGAADEDGGLYGEDDVEEGAAAALPEGAGGPDEEDAEFYASADAELSDEDARGE